MKKLKQCVACKEWKPDDQFYGYIPNVRCLKGVCALCNVSRDPNAFKVDGHERVGLRAMYMTYGITRADKERMMQEQEDACAICRKPFDKAREVIDHNHTTGKVRGILCYACNVGIGQFKEKTELLSAAIAYLEKHK